MLRGYDKQGNPTSYLGHTLTWEKGRQLKKFDSNTHTYNANGIRTSKTVNGVKHTYTLDGMKILRETWGSNTLIPLYDNEDSVCGIIYNEIPYYFQKNLQGDIIAIADKDGKVIANYNYDTCGVCTVTKDTSNRDIASINPYRYRGCYFDSEIEMYYLQSRYYSPMIGRFLNVDEIIMMAAGALEQRFANLFVYSENKFVIEYDPYGNFSISVTTAGIIFELLILVIVLAVAYFSSAKVAYKVASFSKWFRSKLTAAIHKLSVWIANAIDTLFYDLIKRYNSAGKTNISIAASEIENFLNTLITLTPGFIIANIIDRFDKDGKNGVITF